MIFPMVMAMQITHQAVTIIAEAIRILRGLHRLIDIAFCIRQNLGFDDYQTAFDLLFKCAVYTTSLALQHMQSQQWGRIVNIASVSVKEPLNYLALSNSLRAALVTWAKSLSMDIAADNITINNTLTGYFDTERIAQLNAQKAEKMKISPKQVRAAMEAQVPMQRIGRPEEYANLVCFLASEQASYITGTNIPIDGGLLKSF